MKVTGNFRLRNVTKGALRYEGLESEDPQFPDHLIGTLYLRKQRIEKDDPTAGEWPQIITVTVEW